MSKLRFAYSFETWSSESESTYSCEPSRPYSSAPQNANLRCWRGFTFSADSSSAISRIVALPLPLSLIPGPAATESRWAPTTSTLFGSPVLESAITLYVVRFGSYSVEVLTDTVTGPDFDSANSVAPSA